MMKQLIMIAKKILYYKIQTVLYPKFIIQQQSFFLQNVNLIRSKK